MLFVNTPIYQYWLRVWQAILLGDRGYAAGYREGLADGSRSKD